MDSIILASVPIIVNVLMMFVKKIPEFSEMKEGNRKVSLRASAYLLSVVSLYLSQYVSSGLDFSAIESMISGFVTFLMSQGLYLITHKTQK